MRVLLVTHGRVIYLEVQPRVDIPSSIVQSRHAGLIFQTAQVRWCIEILVLVQTETAVRYSLVTHGRDCPEGLRDVRGFATKFYTSEGNWDLVGNNIPVRNTTAQNWDLSMPRHSSNSRHRYEALCTSPDRRVLVIKALLQSYAPLRARRPGRQ